MSLVIKHCQTEDAGNYIVTAKNELGAESAHMKVEVKGKEKCKRSDVKFCKS